MPTVHASRALTRQANCLMVNQLRTVPPGVANGATVAPRLGGLSGALGQGIYCAMVATTSALDLTSSSSGFRDGLGQRTLVFDREHVRTLEALHLRPELGAFGPLVSARIAALSSFRHRRFARSRRVTGSPGRIVVLSDHVPGTRLSEIITAATAGRVTLDADSALYLTSRLLRAVSAFHRATGFTHGALGLERLIVTPRGHLVVAEPMLAPALERLRFSRGQLWRSMRIAMPLSRELPRFDERTDVAQIAVVALSLIHGHALDSTAYPNGFDALLADATLRSRLQLQQPLPLSLHSWFESAVSRRSRQGFSGLEAASHAFDQLLPAEFRGGATRRAFLNFLEQLADVMKPSTIPQYGPTRCQSHRAALRIHVCRRHGIDRTRLSWNP